MKYRVTKSLRLFAVIAGAAFLFQNIELARAKDSDYPTKPITLYIAFGAGGTTDLTARAFGNAAAKYLGQPFTYVNKAGAGGTLTAMAVASAKPDGYSLGTASGSPMFVAPYSAEAPYKDLSNFTFIANYYYYIYPMIVKGDAPWKTWKEFIEWAKKNPGAAKIALTGSRSVQVQGLVLWPVEKQEKVQFSYVPFKSGSEILSATLGGHVTMYGSTVDPNTVPYLKDGKLRILLYLGNEKVPDYENIPSLNELYGYAPVPNLGGIIGPKGLPDDVLKRLDDAFAKAARDPEFVSFMKKMYTPIVYMDRAQMNKYVAETFLSVGAIVKDLKAEEAKGKK